MPPVNGYTDTIIAQASARGVAERGILRISGSLAAASIGKIVQNPETVVVTLPSVIVDVKITLPDFPPFPAKLFIWQHGHSYTGEETVEIHTAGSQVLLDAITAAILTVSENVRLATPGEFTLRAFLSGRLDLTQAEAVLGVIEAANAADLTTALNQLAGNVAAPLSEVWSVLFDLLTEIEAGLDFADEDITFVSPEKIQTVLSEALQKIETLRYQIEERNYANEKPKIVLAGLPNVGKSTLFNKLLQRDAAIVSPQAGTTRDYLEGTADFGGITCTLIDTAGNDSLTLCDNLQADVVVYCYENEPLPFAGDHVLFYRTKRIDESLDDLRQSIKRFIDCMPQASVLQNTAMRCKEAITFASESVRRALSLTDEALVALEIRSAVNHLGLINGTVHTDNILDRIFSRFCIGK